MISDGSKSNTCKNINFALDLGREQTHVCAFAAAWEISKRIQIYCLDFGRKFLIFICLRLVKNHVDMMYISSSFTHSL